MDYRLIINMVYEMFPDARCELDYTSPFSLLVAIMLSAQTTDKKVNLITPLIFSRYKTIEELANANVLDLENIIKPLGLAKNKSKYLKSLSQIIMDKYLGQVPVNTKELETLPGIGHKTACVFMSEYYKEPHIAVDTHVIRVSNRIGLVNTQDVMEAERKLEDIFEKDEYIKVHQSLLFLGRYICKSKKPECEKCLLKEKCMEWRNKYE